MAFGTGKGKRTFSHLRKIILKSLNREQKTVNQIATLTKMNWKSVDNHLTYLIGKGFVREVFSSPYVKIVELTEKGRKTK
jgi:DNA-binding MarR family transcriptional regulator